MVSEKMLRLHFWELFDELFYRIRSVGIWRIISIYFLNKDFLRLIRINKKKWRYL